MNLRYLDEAGTVYSKILYRITEEAQTKVTQSVTKQTAQITIIAIRGRIPPIPSSRLYTDAFILIINQKWCVQTFTPFDRVHSIQPL